MTARARAVVLLVALVAISSCKLGELLKPLPTLRCYEWATFTIIVADSLGNPVTGKQVTYCKVPVPS